MGQVSESQKSAVHLLLHTTGVSFGGEKLTGGLDCAVLELTPPLMARIRKRAAQILDARRQDSALYEMFYWDSEPRYYDCDLISACEEDEDQEWLGRYESQEYAPLPPKIVTRLAAGEFEPRRTECDQMAVSCSPNPGCSPDVSIKWVVIPKHDGIYVDTAQISLVELERLAAGEGSS